MQLSVLTILILFQYPQAVGVCDGMDISMYLVDTGWMSHYMMEGNYK